MTRPTSAYVYQRLRLHIRLYAIPDMIPMISTKLMINQPLPPLPSVNDTQPAFVYNSTLCTATPVTCPLYLNLRPLPGASKKSTRI